MKSQMPSSVPILLSTCVLLVFLHGGVLAAPFHHTPSPPSLDGLDVVNTTLSPPPPPARGSDSSVVHVNITPPGPLDLADFAAVHQTSFQSIMEAGGALFESVMDFFQRLASSRSPASSSQV